METIVTEGGMFFDQVASTYEEARPPYPDALYEALRELGVLRSGARVLEIGAGTGEATRAFVDAGAEVLAVEPGPALADRLERRLPAVRVVRSRLEDAHLEAESFDSAVAASALHWVDLEVGLPKLRRALVPGGVLAVWRTVFGNPDVRTPFRDRVAEIASRRTGTACVRPDPLDVDVWMASLTSSGHFDPVAIRRFDWHIDLTTAQVRGLFSTFSDWSPHEVDQAAAAADELGGTVIEHYVTVLCACRSTGTS